MKNIISPIASGQTSTAANTQSPSIVHTSFSFVVDVLRAIRSPQAAAATSARRGKETLRSRSELLTTKTLEKAITAAAMIGLSSPTDLALLVLAMLGR